MPKFINVERGLYRHAISHVYYERNTSGGRDAMLSLHTTKLAIARKELEKRKLARSRSKHGIEEPDVTSQPVTIGDVLQNYAEDGFPDRQVSMASQREAERASFRRVIWGMVAGVPRFA